MPSRPHRLPPVASWRIEGSTYRWTDPAGRAYTIAPDNFGGARRFSAQIRDTRYGGVHHVGGGKTPEEAYKLLAAAYSRGRTKRTSDKRMAAAMNKAVLAGQPVFQRQGAAFEAEWKRDQTRLARSAALTARLAARRRVKNPSSPGSASKQLVADGWERGPMRGSWIWPATGRVVLLGRTFPTLDDRDVDGPTFATLAEAAAWAKGRANPRQRNPVDAGTLEAMREHVRAGEAAAERGDRPGALAGLRAAREIGDKLWYTPENAAARKGRIGWWDVERADPTLGEAMRLDEQARHIRVNPPKRAVRVKNPASFDGVKVRPTGMTGRGLREGAVYTLKAVTLPAAAWLPNAPARVAYDFIPKGGFKASGRFDAHQVDAWLRNGERGDSNGLERVGAAKNPAGRSTRANPATFRKGDHVVTTGGSAGIVQSFEMHDRVSNTDWYIVTTADGQDESWPASRMRKVPMSKAARNAAAMGRMLAAAPKRRNPAAAPAALPSPTRPFKGRYVLPAEDDLQPAVTYTSEVFAIGGILYADVQKHEPGYPPAEIFDGRVADLRGTLHYDSRVRKHQLAPLLRALLGAYAPKRKAA